ncbi:hypothetical protein [Hymenobacter baengnokdamensis]|uniref:hypothetical protein n=1 Tax=Hymenobacter baengnokdamensis TaxID=2615203 RepID=UPI001244251D|nr:hypothetical protein [Hymenobacter baengnokdamensis]
MSFESEMKAQLEVAFNQIGLTMMSEHRACQLLAFVYVLGGAYEPVVFHTRLHSDLLLAAKRLNIEGGEAPTAASLSVLQAYVQEMEEYGWRTQWLEELLADYDLKASAGQLAGHSPNEFHRHQAATRAAHFNPKIL